MEGETLSSRRIGLVYLIQFVKTVTRDCRVPYLSTCPRVCCKQGPARPHKNIKSQPFTRDCELWVTGMFGSGVPTSRIIGFVPVRIHENYREHARACTAPHPRPSSILTSTLLPTASPSCSWPVSAHASRVLQRCACYPDTAGQGGLCQLALRGLPHDKH